MTTIRRAVITGFGADVIVGPTITLVIPGELSHAQLKFLVAPSVSAAGFFMKRSVDIDIEAESGVVVGIKEAE